MMDRTGGHAMLAAIRSWVDIGKDLFALLRDLLLFLLLLIVVAFPTHVVERLREAQVSKIEGPGFSLEIQQVQQAKQEALAASAAVDQSKAQTDEALRKLDEIVAAKPELAPIVNPLRQQVNQSSAALNTAESRLVTTVASQQDVLAKAGAQTAPVTGWMYLGHVDEAKKAWVSRTTDAPWPLTPPATARVTDATYIRAEGAPNARSTARPLGAAAAGQVVAIEAVDTNGHLKAGGWTVWAKVSVQP